MLVSGRLRSDDPAVTRVVLREEPDYSGSWPQGHMAAGRSSSLTLRDLANDPLIASTRAHLAQAMQIRFFPFIATTASNHRSRSRSANCKRRWDWSLRLRESASCPNRSENWDAETSSSSTSMSPV